MVAGRISFSARVHAASRDFWRNERAATSIEYAIIAAGIAATIVFAVNALGDTLYENFYSRLANLAMGSSGQ